jgi:D-threo-aldose 1-dehydrogenase
MTDPNPLAQRPLGRTGLSVSVLGLGTAPLSVPYYENRMVSDARAVDTIRGALAQGVTLFDTAPAYGEGRSERLLGEALAGTVRSDHLLCTKVRREGEWRAGRFTREGVRRSLVESLERLQADHADIALIHDPDGIEQQALDSAYQALQEMRAEGLLKLIGVGTTRLDPLARFAQDADCDVFLMAGHYTLLDHDGLNLLDLCHQKGIAVMMGVVLNTGILATGARPGARYNYREAPSAIVERVRRIEAICARHATPLVSAALQFPLAHPAVSCLVVGAQSPAEVAANVAAVSRPIPPALWDDLQDEGLLPPGAPLPAAGGRTEARLSG